MSYSAAGGARLVGAVSCSVDDPSGQDIMPRGALPGGHVTFLQIRLRTILEYLPDKMQDCVTTTAFVGDQPLAYSTIRLGHDSFDTNSPDGRRRTIDFIRRDSERAAIDQLFGLKERREAEKRVAELERLVADLQREASRIRWWQVRRRLAARS